MKITSIALSAVLGTTMLCASPAFAQKSTGFYGSLGVSGASTSDTGVTYYGPAGAFSGSGGAEDDEVQETAIPNGSDTLGGNYSFKTAFAITGSIGYDFGLIRTDVEVNYSRNKIKAFTIDTFNGSPVTLSAGDGADVCAALETDGCSADGNRINFDGPKLRQLSALANIWLDIPTNLPIEPYIGGGLGIAGFEVDGEGKSQFAWQVGAGAAYHLTPSIALTADVRYRNANSATIAFDDAYGIEVGKIKTWNYGLGIRVTFGGGSSDATL